MRFRYYVTLPLHRLVAEWRPMPEWELPVRSRILHLPTWRRGYDLFERAAVRARARRRVRCWCAATRALVAIVLLVVAARAALHALAHPFPVERYMVESFPSLMALAGGGDRVAATPGVPAAERA